MSQLTDIQQTLTGDLDRAQSFAQQALEWAKEDLPIDFEEIERQIGNSQEQLAHALKMVAEVKRIQLHGE